MAAVPSIGRANQIEGAAAPEAELTRALYEQYATQIFRYCFHQLGSREEAEDAVQSTFLNAFRGIKRGVVPELESAWLFKIAHNVCLSRRRASWRRDRVESPADFDVVEELAPAPSRRADELIGLQDVLEGMPEQQRRAILLREWQGLSYREIGEELDLSQAAVETLIFRARRSLAQGLEQPAERPKRRRLAAGAFGNLLASAQSFLFSGGAAVKVAAAVAVATGTVVVAAPVHEHVPAPPTRAKAHATGPVVRTPTAATIVAPSAPAPEPSIIAAAVPRPAAQHAAPRGRAVRVSHRAVAPRPAAPAAAPQTPAQQPAATATVSTSAQTAPAHGASTRAPAPAASAGKSGESGKANAPGQVKEAGTAAIGKGVATAPGQQKQATAAGSGKADAPGRQRKTETPPPGATTAVAPPAPPADPAPPQDGVAGGNGNADAPGQQKPDDAAAQGAANGNANGHTK